MQLAAMLATKRLVGVAPEVNLSNLLHTGEEAQKWGIHLGFETWGRHFQKSKTGVCVAHKKDFCPLKILKKTRREKFEDRSKIKIICMCSGWYFVMTWRPVSGICPVLIAVWLQYFFISYSQGLTQREILWMEIRTMYSYTCEHLVHQICTFSVHFRVIPADPSSVATHGILTSGSRWG